MLATDPVAPSHRGGSLWGSADHSVEEDAMAVLHRMIGFVITSQPEKAKAFYGDVLGFRLMSDDNFALVFDANGTMIRVGKGLPFTPAQNTVLGWEVDDIRAAITVLAPRGVHFEQFNLPFIKQDELGVWTPPNGDQVAWFKDPDGNVLSISQHHRVRNAL
jgi:catechol 2,3-dioxygenase-like lactoylglutathione lyase family enzyme